MCPELVIVNTQEHCAGTRLGNEGLAVAASTKVSLVLSGLSRQSIPSAPSVTVSLKHCQSQNQEEPEKKALS